MPARPHSSANAPQSTPKQTHARTRVQFTYVKCRMARRMPQYRKRSYAKRCRIPFRRSQRLSYPLERISQMLFLANGRIRSADWAGSPRSSKTDAWLRYRQQQRRRIRNNTSNRTAGIPNAHVNRMVAVRGTRTSGARPGDRMHFVEIPRVPLAHLRAPKEPSWISK